MTSMFVREVKNSSGQVYHQIVESYRNEEGKARQRILLSLGRAEEGNATKLLEALGRHKNGFEALNLAKDVSIDKTYILGPVLFLNTILEKTGLDDIIKSIQDKHPKLEFDLFKVVYTIILSRFIEPCSKLKIFDHWQKTFFSSLVVGDIPLHHFYRTLDILTEHKDELENSLYWKGRDLLNQRTDVVLYDLTTLRFESTWESEELRRFGYSKEKRSDCTQVVLGLLLDTDGIPIGFEVYPGNTFEGNTLDGIVEKIKKKFQIRRLIFVADRGLFSKKNLLTLKKDNGEFIVGCKLGASSRKKQEDYYDLSKFSWIIEGELAVREQQINEERYNCILMLDSNSTLPDKIDKLILLQEKGGNMTAYWEECTGKKSKTLSQQERENIYSHVTDKITKIEDAALVKQVALLCGCNLGDRLIITWSKSRAERDLKTREDIINKIKLKLDKNPNTKKFVSNSNYQKFVKGLDAGKPKLNELAIEKAKAKDGFFGVLTNVTSLTQREIILNYKQLWKIEDAFGELKGTLEARPIFHWTDVRIIGHLTACFLSYYCEAVATKCLREKQAKLKEPRLGGKTRALTVTATLTDLSEVRAIPVKIKNQIVWVRTDIAGNAATGLQAIGCRIPPKVLKIEEIPNL